jgi:hypothetical protein
MFLSTQILIAGYPGCWCDVNLVQQKLDMIMTAIDMKSIMLTSAIG